MDQTDVLIDAFTRVRQIVLRVLDGLDPDDLTRRIAESANTIGWLAWHLTRIQDDHVADVAGSEQVWTAQGWYERFEVPFDPSATGYGHSDEEVAAVQAPGQLLAGYHAAVHDRTVEYLRTLTAADLDRVVDTRWNPPVTLGVRLVSVIADDLQHAGQAAFVRGLLPT